MTIKIKGSKIQKISGGVAPNASTNVQTLNNKALPCIHEWEVRPPRISKTVAEKRKALARSAMASRKTGNRPEANSYTFEGKAAKHNGVKDGNSMSGPKDASKLYVFCKKCNQRDREVDHVIRDDTGKITSIVEVKSGRAHIRQEQFDALQEICRHVGASLVYKIQSGEGSADSATKFLQENGLPSSNIVVI